MVQDSMNKTTRFRTGWGDPRHIMFPGGVVQSPPWTDTQTDSHLATSQRPEPQGAFVALNMWLDAANVHHHISRSQPSASLSDHWQFSGLASKQTDFRALVKEYVRMKWQELTCFSRRETSKAEAEYHQRADTIFLSSIIIKNPSI